VKPPGYTYHDAMTGPDGHYYLGSGRRRIGAGFGRRRRFAAPQTKHQKKQAKKIMSQVDPTSKEVRRKKSRKNAPLHFTTPPPSPPSPPPVSNEKLVKFVLKHKAEKTTKATAKAEKVDKETRSKKEKAKKKEKKAEAAKKRAAEAVTKAKKKHELAKKSNQKEAAKKAKETKRKAERKERERGRKEAKAKEKVLKAKKAKENAKKVQKEKAQKAAWAVKKVQKEKTQKAKEIRSKELKLGLKKQKKIANKVPVYVRARTGGKKKHAYAASGMSPKVTIAGTESSITGYMKCAKMGHWRTTLIGTTKTALGDLTNVTLKATNSDGWYPTNFEVKVGKHGTWHNFGPTRFWLDGKPYDAGKNYRPRPFRDWAVLFPGKSTAVGCWNNDAGLKKVPSWGKYTCHKAHSNGYCYGKYGKVVLKYCLAACGKCPIKAMTAADWAFHKKRKACIKTCGGGDNDKCLSSKKSWGAYTCKKAAKKGYCTGRYKKYPDLCCKESCGLCWKGCNPWGTKGQPL